MRQTNEYIIEHWAKTVRYGKSDCKEIELPYPVTVPCESQRYTSFFYWDTYFINRGLLYDLPKQAFDNLRNMKYLAERFGFIPNANLTCVLNRSQPPLYCSAVYDYYEKFPSKEVVEEFYPSMCLEYEFWESKRILDCGLNCYGSSATEGEIRAFIKEVALRGVLDELDENAYEKAKNLLAEAESGWDFTPRFHGKALDYAPVDLNAILYRNEKILSEFADRLGKPKESTVFAKAAETRRLHMDLLMKDGEGFYRDYNCSEDKRSDILSVVGLLPYWAGVSRDRATSVRLAEILECEHGIAACEKSKNTSYQWDYPNLWPPLVDFAVSALQNVGANDTAKRIAEKYLQTVAENFARDCCLYEKYSAVTGKRSDSEYESPKMLGWTAGVFRKLYRLYMEETCL